LAQARAQLAGRLYDAGQVFWSPAELNLYLVEALRTWNALTGYWRGDFTFSLTPTVQWYDLTAQPGTLRPFTLYDTDLYRIIQYHLLEAVAWNPWTGASAQFNAADLTSALQSCRDELLSTVACTLTRSTVGAVAGRIQLPDTTIDIRRMAYLPNTPGVPSIVWPDDTWSQQAFDPLYAQRPAIAGTPYTYAMSTQPPINFDAYPPPAYAGLYELITVNVPPSPVVSAPSLLLIPDDWTHVLKWGALMELFSRESVSRDPLRAQYCATRYRMGLKMMTLAPALLAMRVNNVAIQVDSVRAADLYNTSWQSQAAGPPADALHAGLNLIAIAPPPGTAEPYTMTATVVQNAPVPILDTDYFQVGRDDVDAVIDYAQHLAALKEGGAEFLATMPLLSRFMQQATVYGFKLAELGEYTTMLNDLSQRENDMSPVLSPATTQPVSASGGGS
jgi:hypothetical protein